MKKHFTISLIVVALAAILALIMGSGRNITDFMITYGTVCCILGAVCLLIGFFFTGRHRNRDTAEAFFMSAGITFLIGTGVCGVTLARTLSHWPGIILKLL
jgi:hypothetical protein